MSAKLEAGTVFAGRYRVVRCLAAGGMGAVYEAIHLETDRRRALKVMHPHLFQSEDMRERFKREARIAAQIDSEYIVDVSDAGVDEATQMPFLVMELLRGEELGDRLKRMGRLPPEEVVLYMQQAAWALDRTHAASIVHRDLKPANLFLTTREDGTPRIKILDFGVAKLIAESATAAGATQSLGTPIYMAPEQFRTNARLTAAADIYALTLMTYTLLVGGAYWAEEAKGSGDVIAFAITALNGPQEAAVQRAARRGVALPPGFDAWFAKGTALNPTDRFRTATEAIRALRAVESSTVSGVTPIAPRSATASDTDLTAPVSRSVLASSPDIEQVTTSLAGSAITTPQVGRSRVPLVAGAAVLGISIVGLGGWLTLHPVAPSRVSPASLEANLAVTTIISADSAAPRAVPVAASAAPVAASAAPVAASAAPVAASAAPAALAAPAAPRAVPVAASAAPVAASAAPAAPSAASAVTPKVLFELDFIGSPVAASRGESPLGTTSPSKTAAAVPDTLTAPAKKAASSPPAPEKNSTPKPKLLGRD